MGGKSFELWGILQNALDSRLIWLHGAFEMVFGPLAQGARKCRVEISSFILRLLCSSTISFLLLQCSKKHFQINNKENMEEERGGIE